MTLSTHSVQSANHNTDSSMYERSVWSSLTTMSPPKIKNRSVDLSKVSQHGHTNAPWKRTLTRSAAYFPGVTHCRIINDSLKQLHYMCEEDVNLFSGLCRRDSGPISVRVRLPCFQRSGSSANYRERNVKSRGLTTTPRRVTLTFSFHFIHVNTSSCCCPSVSFSFLIQLLK